MLLVVNEQAGKHRDTNGAPKEGGGAIANEGRGAGVPQCVSLFSREPAEKLPYFKYNLIRSYMIIYRL